MAKTLKRSPVRGWKREKPSRHQRTMMLRKCGKKCFLGKSGSFPICKKNTCKISGRGVYAAYIRARQYSSKGAKYRKVASRANRLLNKMGLRCKR
jgi:hypothetical protein